MGVRSFLQGRNWWFGKRLNAVSYGYDEMSTPVDPTDTYGGSPQLTANYLETPELKYSGDRELVIQDGSRGRAFGIVRTPSGNGSTVTLAADGRLSLANVDRVAQPYSGTLNGAILYYLGLVGLTDQIIIDLTIGARPVALPGWQANVWNQLKKLLVVHRCEITEIGTQIVVRPLRQRIAQRIRDTGKVSWSVDRTQRARTVEAYFYNSTAKTNAVFYPTPEGWTSDTTIISVDAGATVIQEFDIEASLSSVQQPSAVSSVDRSYVASSVYSVIGNDGLVIPPAQWVAGGGNVTVEILENTKRIRVTVTGSSELQYAPYRLAMPSGTTNAYSSLRIVGTGVFFSDRALYSIATGANPDIVTQEVGGGTVDNEFFDTIDRFYDAMIWAAAKYGGPQAKITLQTAGIQRLGERNAYLFPTIRQFNAQYLGQTIAQFNAAWANKTIRQFNAAMDATVVDEFRNQAYGNMGGARLLDDGQWYRVRHATRNGSAWDLELDRDTTIRDFNDRYKNMTIAQFNQFWSGYRIGDFDVRPLRTS